MSAAIPLPAAPDPEDYEQEAKRLLRAAQSDDPAALRAWVERWAAAWGEGWIATQAHLRGVPVTPALRDELPGEIERIERQLRAANLERPADARLFLARAHGFTSWAEFADHIRALQRPDSPDAAFESAVEAIISGDVPRLSRLLADHPDLVHQRSRRAHRSTLLHYVSANGVEDDRQRTPHDAVEIARLLLDAGAAVDAESDAYGGGMTTLDLAATSVHPWRAGVQIPLLELLLARGARIEARPGAAVHACLANGRGDAAAFLATRGAHLTFAGAAGVGRLDRVRAMFDGARDEEIRRGFLWACQFGRAEVVRFLVERGVDAAAADHAGMTGLDWAAHGGHAAIVQLLRERSAGR